MRALALVETRSNFPLTKVRPPLEDISALLSKLGLEQYQAALQGSGALEKLHRTTVCLTLPAAVP